MAFWSPVSNLVAFGASGIPCGAVCPASWMLFCAIGAVLGGCGWCVTITIMAWCGLLGTCHGRLHPQVWSCGRLVFKHAGWQSGSLQCQLTRGCLEGFGHKLVKELSFMAIGMHNTATQLVLLVFIVDHLAVVHQCFDVCNKVLRDLSRPGYKVLKFF